MDLLYLNNMITYMYSKNQNKHFYPSFNMEVEVFRISEFSKEANYAFALKTKTQGVYPNAKHYTMNPLLYLGKHVSSARWGYHDNAGGSETFDNNGKKTDIIYDYNGNTCFVIV